MPNAEGAGCGMALGLAVVLLVVLYSMAKAAGL
jgi:hypothetical protein